MNKTTITFDLSSTDMSFIQALSAKTAIPVDKIAELLITLILMCEAKAHKDEDSQSSSM